MLRRCPPRDAARCSLVAAPQRVQMEFTRGLVDTVVKAAAIVALQEEKDVEALKADHYLKAVSASKNAAVSEMVEARTSAMWAQQVVSEVRGCARHEQRTCMHWPVARAGAVWFCQLVCRV